MEDSADLERFRQEWREEVNSRRRGSFHKVTSRETAAPADSETWKWTDHVKRPPGHHTAAETPDDDAKDGAYDAPAAPSLIQKIEGLAIRDVDDDDFSGSRTTSEPKSALEHYERAVEKESQGNLGDSLSHYRKAYRMDAKVDQSYKNKHFPTKSKPSHPNPSNASPTVPNTAHHSLEEPIRVLTTLELVQSFADAPILGAEPLIKGDIPPPCPIKDIPHEVLIELLLRTAILDPASFCRLARVCKKLAYHVFNENSIWKRVALGPEFGLASQVYQFETDLQGRELVNRPLGHESFDIIPSTWPEDQAWRDVFHGTPRVRFTGVYISTVNYTRPGHVLLSSAAWNSPVHIVTYYRYIRFFRDGTVISLLSTNEPIDVVHHLTRENLNLVRSPEKGHPHPLSFTTSSHDPNVASKEVGTATTNSSLSGSTVTAAPPPTAQHLMRHALRGRWRLCRPSDQTSVADIATNGASQVGDIHIETEGAGPRYMYTLHLALRSGSRAKNAVKNNKLVWKGFWSYNTLTNDWAEFQLRNDKAFYFSRVKSYGLGY